MIRLPAPTNIDGDHLAEEITAAGFTEVDVLLVGDEVIVNAAELVDPMPPAEDRIAAGAEGQEVLDALLADGQKHADKANAKALAVIAPIVAAHAVG